MTDSSDLTLTQELKPTDVVLPSETTVFDPSLVQEQAKKLRESGFLFLVAFNIAAQMILHLVNRGDIERLTIIDGAPLLESRYSVYTHELLLQTYQNDNRFWMDKAQWILERLKEQLENQSTSRAEEQLRSECANQTAVEILNSIYPPKLLSCELEQIIGLWQEQVEVGLTKISYSQKIILCTLFKQTWAISRKDISRKAFEWNPDEWREVLPRANGPSLSTTLKRLAERGLLVRLDSTGAPITEETDRKRTVGVQITPLGFLVAKEITISEEKRIISNEKTEFMSFHLVKKRKRS